MPSIQIARPKWSEDQVHRALERELRTGIQLKQAIEEERQIAAAKEAAQYDKRKTTPMGKHIAEIPAWEWHNMVRKYGYDEVHSKEFMRYFQKKFKHLSTAKV